MERSLRCWPAMEEELKRPAADVADFGAQATIWPCDLQGAQDAERTISSIVERYGRIDVLVNNAGIIIVAPF
ncbi:MAG: SDR family NAD(P)-dependent oxidoreductase [Terrimicrobiaceae bacterium]